jgi:hypothetical protein
VLAASVDCDVNRPMTQSSGVTDRLKRARRIDFDKRAAIVGDSVAQ